MEQTVTILKQQMGNIKDRIDTLEKSNTKRVEDLNTIEKAIIAIQVANEQTAKTLERLENVVQFNTNNNNDKWFKLIEKGLLILAGVISALVGTQIM